MIRIRKLQKSDLQLRVEWMNNPKIYSNMHFKIPITMEGTLKWFEKNQRDNNRIDFAFDDEAGNVVAMGGLVSIDEYLKKAEFYLFVGPLYHRLGYGFTATKLICKYGFESINLHKIALFANYENTPARCMYEKVGFKLEGVFRDENIVNGKYTNRVYYGLLNKDFINNFH